MSQLEMQSNVALPTNNLETKNNPKYTLDYSQNPKGSNLQFHTKQSLFQKIKKRLDILATLPSVRKNKYKKELKDVLEAKGIQRRDFMKWAAVVTASLGLPSSFAPLTMKAAELAGRVPIIWLHMAECTGCSESLLRSEDPSIDSIIFDYVSLEYHETIMAASGYQAEKSLEDAVQNYKGRYVMMVEGGIPKDTEYFLTIGAYARTGAEECRHVAEHAAAIFAIGTCSSFGGVQAAAPNPTNAHPLSDIIKKNVINVPGCPPSEKNIVGTLMYYILFGEMPAIDAFHRPKWAYGHRIHDLCERRGHFDAGEFVQNFGDENVYSKENLEKIYDYKKQNNDIYNFDFDIEDILNSVIDQMKDILPYISLVFLGFFVVAIYTNKDKRWFILGIFLTTILTNIIFIVVGRTMHRVVIPEYILGSAIFLYFINYRKQEENKDDIIKALSIFIIVITIIFAGEAYKFNYNLEDYRNYKDVIEYTNSNKQNVYLYTVPALQFRYLVYPVYEMPPKQAFSNLRVMGGWDMFTKNYYDFKERYNLEGTFLDLLKENVYLIDGDVVWSGNYYQNYIDNIVLFIKEHYDKDVTYEKIETFDNIYVYKLREVAKN